MNALNSMPDHARIWIYQSSRFLTPEEVAHAKKSGEHFIHEWSSHGQSMDAALDVIENLFLIVAVDEAKAMASGCGIDNSVRFVQNLGQEIGVDFLDRKTVAYRGNDQILLAPVQEFWAMRKAGIIDSETLVYDNLVPSLGEWRKRWCVPFAMSWHQEVWGR